MCLLAALRTDYSGRWDRGVRTDQDIEQGPRQLLLDRRIIGCGLTLNPASFRIFGIHEEALLNPCIRHPVI